MILNTGQRTDIPSYYWPWFLNRLKEGYVLVRNPYYPKIVTRYEINPDVVDLIGFCTKDPRPALKHMELLKPYRQYWFVTITPYGKDVEPHVGNKWEIMDAFRALAGIVGIDHIGWRYDPVLLNDKYTIAYHLRAFEKMTAYLEGYTNTCVFSFIDLYQKTIKNFPGVQEVSPSDKNILAEQMAETAKRHGMVLRGCHEDMDLSRYGIDMEGCFRSSIAEQAVGEQLDVPPGKAARQGCTCLLSGDIGAYNTCGHGCLYCYANYDNTIVIENMKAHDPFSPLLTGHLHPDDEIHEADQKSWIGRQLKLNL